MCIYNAYDNFKVSPTLDSVLLLLPVLHAEYYILVIHLSVYIFISVCVVLQQKKFYINITYRLISYYCCLTRNSTSCGKLYTCKRLHM